MKPSQLALGIAAVLCALLFIALFGYARFQYSGKQGSLLNIQGSATQRSLPPVVPKQELDELLHPMYCCPEQRGGEECTLVDTDARESCGKSVRGEFVAGLEFQPTKEGLEACAKACRR